MIAEIVDLLYEAAFVPEKWPAILGLIASVAKSQAGSLLLLSDGFPDRATATAPLQALLDEFFADGLLHLSTSIARMNLIQPASFVDVDSFMTAEEIRTDPVRIRLRAQGWANPACTTIAMPSGEIAMLGFQRALDEGSHGPQDISVLNQLRPDLARATLAAARLGLQQARDTVEALAMIGLPAAVLTAKGCVRATNALFDKENGLFASTSFGRVAIDNPEGNRLFQLALDAPSGQPVTRSIPLRGAAGLSFVLHILPLRRAARDIFSGGDHLVVATMVSPSALVPSPSILMGLFDLTPSEVKLATALAKGLSLKAAATEAGLQVSTVRTYLSRIFRKTGTNQQSQLVALLKSAHPFHRWGKVPPGNPAEL
jgi:DNA-binding CsgD family transcriptional regulator